MIELIKYVMLVSKTYELGETEIDNYTLFKCNCCNQMLQVDICNKNDEEYYELIPHLKDCNMNKLFNLKEKIKDKQDCFENILLSSRLVSEIYDLYEDSISVTLQCNCCGSILTTDQSLIELTESEKLSMIDHSDDCSWEKSLELLDLLLC